MAFSSNIKELIAQMQEEIIPEVDRKLRGMVIKFSTQVVQEAQTNTPLGDSTENFSAYMQRYKNTGLKAVEGHAQSSWQVTYKGAGKKGGYVPEVALMDASSKLQSFKLGQTINILNNAVYIKELENGHSDQAPDGIMHPTEKVIMQVYSHDLGRYYKES